METIKAYIMERCALPLFSLMSSLLTWKRFWKTSEAYSDSFTNQQHHQLIEDFSLITDQEKWIVSFCRKTERIWVRDVRWKSMEKAGLVTRGGGERRRTGTERGWGWAGESEGDRRGREWIFHSRRLGAPLLWFVSLSMFPRCCSRQSKCSLAHHDFSTSYSLFILSCLLSLRNQAVHSRLMAHRLQIFL